MFKSHKIVAIIPAREGSKGLKHKNIKFFAGKPLLAWSVIQALNSEFIDDVYVSTDSQKYANIAKEYGGKTPYLRPDTLSGDNARSTDVLIHMLEWLSKNAGNKYDYVVLVEPTSPLRCQDDFDNAIADLIKNRDIADSIVSVMKIQETGHPDLAKSIDNGLLKPYSEESIDIHQRQQLNPVYQLEGTLYVSRVDVLKRKQRFVHERTMAYLTKRWQHTEIDDIYDFVCAESLIKFKQKDL
jgi:N-acylneuraminate cytidylyltransferase/CMP-N,N'-diacetyllegionaminic acid synthase